MTTPYLPNEIINRIAGELVEWRLFEPKFWQEGPKQSTLANMRLVSRTFNNAALPYCFKAAQAEISPGGLRKLERLANSRYASDLESLTIGAGANLRQMDLLETMTLVHRLRRCIARFRGLRSLSISVLGVGFDRGRPHDFFTDWRKGEHVLYELLFGTSMPRTLIELAIQTDPGVMKALQRLMPHDPARTAQFFAMVARLQSSVFRCARHATILASYEDLSWAHLNTLSHLGPELKCLSISHANMMIQHQGLRRYRLLDFPQLSIIKLSCGIINIPLLMTILRPRKNVLEHVELTNLQPQLGKWAVVFRFLASCPALLVFSARALRSGHANVHTVRFVGEHHGHMDSLCEAADLRMLYSLFVRVQSNRRQQGLPPLPCASAFLRRTTAPGVTIRRPRGVQQYRDENDPECQRTPPGPAPAAFQ